MVSIDDLLKIALVFAIVFAIVGISYQFMRLISKVVQILEDLRHPIKNASELTDYVLEDYMDARSLVREGIADLSSIKQYLDNPVLIGGFLLKAFSKPKGTLSRREE